MPTCPNCGEIVMNGDPYCPHCGTTFRWVDDEYEMKRERKNKRPLKLDLKNISIARFYDVLDQFREPDSILIDIKNSFDLSNAKNTVVDMYKSYGGDVKISFKRQNKYFTTIDYVTYSPDRNTIGDYSFNTNFYNLENTEWFKRAVKQKEKEIGLKYYSCAGGYDACYHWEGKELLELKDGCSVVAHFVVDEATTKGYYVDFRNHGLKKEYKVYDRISYDLLIDYDWDY